MLPLISLPLSSQLWYVSYVLFLSLYAPADKEKLKLELTTLPRIFVYVVCQLNLLVFAIQR